jgi:DNA-binding XRE family transcriptional regulator
MTKSPGRIEYEAYREKELADPAFREAYEREAEKMDLWLALADARNAAGLTQTEMAERLGVSQAQVARIEKRGYDAHSLSTLRRYVAALGAGYTMEIVITGPDDQRFVA